MSRNITSISHEDALHMPVVAKRSIDSTATNLSESFNMMTDTEDTTLDVSCNVNTNSVTVIDDECSVHDSVSSTGAVAKSGGVSHHHRTSRNASHNNNQSYMFSFAVPFSCSQHQQQHQEGGATLQVNATTTSTTATVPKKRSSPVAPPSTPPATQRFSRISAAGSVSDVSTVNVVASAPVEAGRTSGNHSFSNSRKAPLSPPRTSRLQFSQRIGRDIELGRKFESTCDAPVLRAEAVEHAVGFLEEGIQCCPVVQFARSHNGTASIKKVLENACDDAHVNLSPFKEWEFTPFLYPRPPHGDCHLNTIVLDLDETLVHTSVKWMPDADAAIDIPVMSRRSGKESESTSPTPQMSTIFIKYRPFIGEFLAYCLKHFEVVLFTASRGAYAKAVLGQIEKDFPGVRVAFQEGNDPVTSGGEEGIITLLHRDHCTPTNAGFVKDLFLLGRDLRHVFLVDNYVLCGAFQPYSCIHVKDFARRACDADAFAGNEKDTPLSLRSTLLEVKGTPRKNQGGDAEVSCCSTLQWEDTDDAVLQSLICEGGLLDSLRSCDNIPQFLTRTMLYNCDFA